MKKILLIISLVFSVVPLLSKEKFKSLQIIYSSLDYPTTIFYKPIFFDLGICEDKCDTLEITDEQDIDKIIKSLRNLTPSKRLTLDTRGKLIFKRPFEKMDNIWVYWSIADLQIGLNGRMFCLNEAFAKAINEILYKYRKVTFFNKEWFESFGILGK